MSAEQKETFRNSKVMQQSQQVDDTVAMLMMNRNQELMLLDKDYRPQADDFNAPKAYNYDRGIDYYGVLGLPSMVTIEDIKHAYKRLSLLYHPDKTGGMSQEQRDLHQAIFIQLKNAYTLLLDTPTRRQYDQERMKDQITSEICGIKTKQKQQFWGYEERSQQINQEMAKTVGPGDTIDVHVACRLEKFVYSGLKTVERSRWARLRGEWQEQHKTFRLDVPAGAGEPIEKIFAQKGNEHEDKLPDTLRFLVWSKPRGPPEGWTSWPSRT
jgi:hypothetical protein